MDITIKNLEIGDEKTNRLLAFLDAEEIEWTTKPVPQQSSDSTTCTHTYKAIYCGFRYVAQCTKCGSIRQ